MAIFNGCVELPEGIYSIIYIVTAFVQRPASSAAQVSCGWAGTFWNSWVQRSCSSFFGFPEENPARTVRRFHGYPLVLTSVAMEIPQATHLVQARASCSHAESYQNGYTNPYPLCSMYYVRYISLQNWVIFSANVGKYSIHGAYGYGLKTTPQEQGIPWYTTRL